MKKFLNVALSVIAVITFISTLITKGWLFFILFLACWASICALLELNGNNVTRY